MWFYSPCQLIDVELFGKGKPKVYFYIKLLSLLACLFVLFVCLLDRNSKPLDRFASKFLRKSVERFIVQTNKTLTEITTLFIEKSVQCTVYTVQQKNGHIYQNHKFRWTIV